MCFLFYRKKQNEVFGQPLNKGMPKTMPHAGPPPLFLDPVGAAQVPCLGGFARASAGGTPGTRRGGGLGACTLLHTQQLLEGPLFAAGEYTPSTPPVHLPAASGVLPVCVLRGCFTCVPLSVNCP